MINKDSQGSLKTFLCSQIFAALLEICSSTECILNVICDFIQDKNNNNSPRYYGATLFLRIPVYLLQSGVVHFGDLDIGNSNIFSKSKLSHERF